MELLKVLINKRNPKEVIYVSREMPHDTIGDIYLWSIEVNFSRGNLHPVDINKSIIWRYLR